MLTGSKQNFRGDIVGCADERVRQTALVSDITSHQRFAQVFVTVTVVFDPGFVWFHGVLSGMVTLKHIGVNITFQQKKAIGI